MPRVKRNFGTTGFNHCIIRGINKCDIFFDDQDRYKFIKITREFKEKYKVKIGVYVLMQNHVHLVINCNKEKIPNFFHGLLVSYSYYFNKKYERVGHLFENRYKNKPVETEEYLRNLVKYIHHNPEKAGICKATEYKWSSYNEFYKKNTWIDREMILKFYGDSQEEALKNFEKENKESLGKYYENYSEFEMVNRLTDEQVKYIIDNIEKRLLAKKQVSWEKSYRDKIIKEVIGIKGISVNQISRVTGINRKVINRLKEELKLEDKKH